MFILIFVQGIATALIVIWFILLRQAEQEDYTTTSYNKLLDCHLAIEALHMNDAEKAKQLAQYHGIPAKVMRLFIGKGSEKKIENLEKQAQAVRSGDCGLRYFLDLPGYVLQRKILSIKKGRIHRSLLSKCSELYGEKYGENKTTQLLARLLSYPALGVSASLTFGVLLAGGGNRLFGYVVMAMGTLIVFVLSYALYDDISDKLNKRRSAISRQFPNVVSKLALLVTSGMGVDRAWRETAESQDMELYQEMKKTAEELSNLVAPEVAYNNFINRCNTKETTKLASAILQSHSKGNSEIGVLLKAMAHDAWQERRHNAKRESEKANSKLMIPTMLLFLAILVMIMVPIALTFSGL